MGFAGQVFAARVAIGLAFPSKQAMGQASQIIGAGASALYKKMNSMQLKASSARRGAAEKDLSDMQQRIEKHRSTLQSKLAAGQARFTKSMRQANQGAKVTAGRSMSEYKKSQKAMGSAKGTKHIENTFKAGKRAFVDFANHVKKRSPDLAIEIFGKEGNMDKIHDNFDIGKMSELFGKEGKEAERMQKELLQIAKLEMENAQRRHRNGVEEIKMMRFKTKWLMATKQLTGTAGAEALDLLDEEERAFKDNLNAARDFHQIVKGMSDERAQVQREHQQDTDQLLKKEKTLREKVKEAIMGESKALKALEKGAARAAKKAAQFAEALKNNFGNALRESISALTAMFYKLQQNSQELIEFERELMNANSVFNLTREELYKTSEVITQFGQAFGMEMQNGAEGLYQLASAGLSADQSMKVLPSTLKLSMAVQGDHNTIAKLTTQTLMGFSMEMEQAAEVTDKFAHVIQKSLIEYEDLTSAVKFAMPFFTATGQSLDQLLGALEVLTNRALEAGIAGRGLRQALAEFAEHADDNTAAFARMGLEIKKADGSMKDLTVIAKEYSDIIGPEASKNTELLTALIEDLNVRGATAFVHLVQNADEFGQAVEDVANAGGELDEMVRIQNESMQAQIQILKNNVQMMFFYSDGVDRANGAMNNFHSAIIEGITSFQDLIVTGEEGNKQLTEFGLTIQDVAVEAVTALIELLKDSIGFLKGFAGQGKMALGVLKAYLLPIKVLMKAMDFMGPRVTSLVIQFSMLNKLFSLTAGIRATAQGFITLYQYIFTATAATVAETTAVETNIIAKVGETGVNNALAKSELDLAASRGTAAASGAGAAGGGTAVGALPPLKKGYNMDVEGNVVGPSGGVIKPNKSGKFSKSKVARFGASGKSAASAAPKPAKIGLVTKAMEGLAIVISGLFSLTTALVLAVAAIGVVGLQVMGSLKPTIEIIKGWGESIKWAFAKAGAYIVQTAGSFGLIGESMKDAKVKTASALDEMKWMFVNWGMRISMSLGVLVGGVVFMMDQLFKGMYNVIMDAIGNSYITDAIVGGFTGIWEALFNPTDGWLRWLTATYWSDKFSEIKTFMTSYNWGDMVPNDIFGFSFSLPEFMQYDYWFGTGGIWSELVGGFELFKADPFGTMVVMAKISMNAFLNVYNAFAAAINGINFEFNTGGWDAKTMPMWTYSKGWYNQQIIGAFDGVGFGVNMAGAMPIKDLIELQTGGYVTGMQSGGYAGQRNPYLVGEAGPELFMPNQSGQVINNSRTDSILRNSMNSGGLKPQQGNNGQTMFVDRLEVKESTMNRSKIAVDTFAGVV